MTADPCRRASVPGYRTTLRPDSVLSRRIVARFWVVRRDAFQSGIDSGLRQLCSRSGSRTLPDLIPHLIRAGPDTSLDSGPDLIPCLIPGRTHPCRPISRINAVRLFCTLYLVLVFDVFTVVQFCLFKLFIYVYISQKW